MPATLTVSVCGAKATDWRAPREENLPTTFGRPGSTLWSLHVERQLAKKIGDVLGDPRLPRVLGVRTGIANGTDARYPHEVLQQLRDLLVVHGLRAGGWTSTHCMLAARADAIPAVVSSNTRHFSGAMPSCRAASRNGSGAGLPCR